MGLPPLEHDPQELRDIADRILAEARFDQPAESLPERIQGWFADRIADALGRLVGTGSATLIAWIVVLGAVGAVIYLVLRHGRTVRLDRPATERSTPMVELSRSPGEWRAMADELEAAGRWKEALRCRHRALVADLVRRGVIPDQAGRTAREYAADVALGLPHAAAPMTDATDLFEAAWYGDVPTGAEESARFRELDALVLGPAREAAGAGR